MARTVTLGDLATRVRYEADLVNNQFVTDTMLYQFISDSYTLLYNKLLRADPERYMREQFPTLDSEGEFEADSDYYGTINLDWSENSNDGVYVNVPRAWGVENNRYDHDITNSGVPSAWHPIYNTATPNTPKFRVLPKPDARYQIRHKYTVAPAVLSTSTDTIDGIAGWEEYIVIDAAIKCRIREETSTGALEQRLARFEEELDSMVDARNVAEVGHVIDSRGAERLFDSSSYNWYTRRD